MSFIQNKLFIVFHRTKGTDKTSCLLVTRDVSAAVETARKVLVPPFFPDPDKGYNRVLVSEDVVEVLTVDFVDTSVKAEPNVDS